MQDLITDRFVQELQQCGFIEKADTFCASWKNGSIAQNANGSVLIFNHAIVSDHEKWQINATASGLSASHVLAELPVSDRWREHILPMQLLRDPGSGLTGEQQFFYNLLSNKGAIDKVKGFLAGWGINAWLAMDASGVVYIHNGEPDKGRTGWYQKDSCTAGSVWLGRLEDHPFHWEHCLVKLSAIEHLLRPAPITLPDENRKDCWI